MRVFIAIDPDESSRKEIEKLLKNLAKKHWAVKWEALEKVHITLAFLGEINGSQLEITKNQLRNLNIGPFILSFKGLGCFPDYDWPQIIWLGLKGDLKSLSFLHKEIQERLVNAGFKLDKKPFIPHITIGRIKNPSPGQRQEIARQIKAMQKMEFKSEWKVNQIIIYESRCLPRGSVYQKLKVIQLET